MTRRRAGFGVRLVLVGTTVLVSTPGHSESRHPLLDTEHLLYLGFFDQRLEADIGAQRDDRPDELVNFADLGAADKDPSWMAEYRWRFAERWSLGLAAYRYRNSGSSVVEEDFNFEGQDFTAGLLTEAALDIDTYIVNAMYTAYATDQFELNVGGGLHALDTDASIRAVGAIDDDIVFDTTTASASTVAPLPNIRASALWAFNERLAVMATGGWLSMNIEDYEGGFIYFHFRGQYQITRHWGLSVGYQIADVDVVHQRDDGKDEFNLGFEGATAALSYAF